MPETTIDKALFQAERHGHSTVMVLTRDLRELMDRLEKAEAAREMDAIASLKSAPPAE